MNGVFINFFGFNGTAGVWRIKALEECGGWLERTTVEDMDVAVRAHLCGWKFIFLNDVRVSMISFLLVVCLLLDLIHITTSRVIGLELLYLLNLCYFFLLIM